jgi:Kef-type K+ transport system membrane component KefB
MMAGIELDLRSAWKDRGESLVVAGFAVFIPLLLGSAAAVFLFLQGGWIGAHAEPWQFVLGVGMACAVTALPILVVFLEKMGILRSPLGQRVLRYASLDDLAIWLILAVILLDWSRLALQGAFIVGFLIVGCLVRWGLPRMPLSDRWFVALIWLCVSAFAADRAGLHFMVGAFLSGVMLDLDWFGRERMDALRSQVLLILMPIFFLSTGLKTDFGVGGQAVFGAAGLLIVASIAGKLMGVAWAGRLLGWKPGESWVIGWLLQTKALIMIIFANILLDHQIIRPDTFTALLLTSVLSTALTIPIVGGRVAALASASRSRAPD